MTDRRVALWAAGAALWTFIAWANRIGLLTGDEASDPWTWIRVGGSLLFGLALAGVAVTLWRGWPFSGWMAGIFVGFGILMLVIWLRSAFSVMGDDESSAFKAVHIVLAAISVGFGLVLSRLGIQRAKG
jgi:hypothetical protein